MLLLLVAVFGLLWVFLTSNRDRIGYGILSVRGSLVLAYLGFELLLLIITEVSSIGHHLTAGAVDWGWAVVVVGLVAINRGPILRCFDRARSHDGTWWGLREHLTNVEVEECMWIGVIAVFFGILVVIGSLYPPSNADSLVYHLTRVEHWVQNRTIAPFATHYLAQIEFSPLAEYNLAHLHLMAGTDRFDAAVQLLAALVSVIGVTELARLLGASRWAQMMSAVVCTTIPTGILVATSTENDYVVAATGIVLLVVLAGFSFEGEWLVRSVAVGIAAGLAYMTKSAILLLLGPPAMVLLVVAAYRAIRWNRRPVTVGTTVGQLAAIPVAAAAVVGPFIAQNIQLFGSAIGPSSRALIISPISIGGMGGNVVRATASEFDVGNGKSGPYTDLARVALPVLRHAYSVFGVGQNDFGYAVTRNSPIFAVRDYTLQQRLGDIGANPWHVLLIAVATVVLLVCVAQGKKSLRVALAVAIALGAGYVLFSGIDRWSPFGVRLVLPLLVAWSATIAIALARFSRWVGRAVLIGLIVASLPQLFDNADAPLVPNQASHQPFLTPYFVRRDVYIPGSVEASAYQTITTMVAQSTCKRAAIANWVLLEYPLWVGLDHEHWNGLLNDFDVHNATEKLEPSYRPCAWITQRGPRYVTPNNGTVNVQVNDLAVSINLSDAASIHTPILSFGSAVVGVRVFPGGGWGLAAVGHDPLLGKSGSLYVFSDSAKTVQLQFHLAPTVPQPSLAISEPDGQSVPTNTTSGTLRADLDLHSGVNLVDLVTGGSAETQRRILVLTRVTVASSGP